MSSSWQDYALQCARGAGAFGLARRLTARDLRIICYHAFSSVDEHLFRPAMFMPADQFGARLEMLRRAGFRFMDLGAACEALERNTLEELALVVTIDDGFHSVYEHALPVIRALKIPCTVYVTSYYVDKDVPVYGLTLQYMAWKNASRVRELRVLLQESNRDVADAKLVSTLVDYGEKLPEESDRQDLLSAAARLLGFDLDDLKRSKRFTLMTSAEIKELIDNGVDIQLHTHRHRLPTAAAAVADEMERNRQALEPLAGRKLVHLCYPSGVWSREHWPLLTANGIRSATTCEPGLNGVGTSPFALKRILDAANLSDVTILAEMSGFKDLVRRTARRSAS